ncbi:MAG: OmpA family protein [Bacteroidota bacterium]
MKLLRTCCSILFGLCCTAVFAQSYTTEKLNASINTADYDEISPVVSIDGQKMYFTRVGYPQYQRTLMEKGEDLSQTMTGQSFVSYLRNIFTTIANSYVPNPESSGFNQDIWVAETNGKDFTRISHPGYPLNNALPNSVCSLTPSGNEVILLNQFVEEGGMQKGFSISRELPDGTWSFPRPININNYHNSGPDVSMTMSFDGSVIIMALERSDSYGKSDLYISFRTGTDTWSEPRNLGPKVNSAQRETTPFLSEDGKTLFFSSNRRGSIGGNDLFILERLDDQWKKWSRPRRFVEPINSRADESQPYFNSATGYLYFTSRRDGSSDVFRVKLARPKPPGVVVKGAVFNAKTGEAVSAKVLSGVVNSSFRNAYVADDGHFRMTIPKGFKYSFIAEAPGYKTVNEETISFKRSYNYRREYEIVLYLDPIEVGSKIDLAPIFFEQSKPVVLHSSYPALDQLAQYLKENRNMYIRIEGHTDNQGEQAALQKLSEDRAEAIKDYLVYKKRINPVRIDIAGMGPDQPIASNETEEDRAKNRRVEVIITHIDEAVLGLQDDTGDRK